MACMRHQGWSMSALDSNLSTSIWPSAIIHTQVCSPSHIDVISLNTKTSIISHKTYYSGHSIYSEIVLPTGSYSWLWWYEYTHSICLKNHSQVKLMSSKNTVTIHTLFFNTFTAIVDLSQFNNSCLKSPTSTLVDLTFQSRSARDWKVRSTKVDAGDFKHELLSLWVFK